jgi:hypothetical protein
VRVPLCCQELDQQTLSDTRKYKNWEKDSAVARAAAKMQQYSKPWTSKHCLHGVPDLPRMRDVIDVAWQKTRTKVGLGETEDFVKQGLWCDPSQGVARNSGSVSYKMPLLTQSNLPYSFEMDACISGRDALILQGFPSETSTTPPHLKDADLRSLAGESFFLPSMAMLTHAYYLNHRGAWWRKD